MPDKLPPLSIVSGNEHLLRVRFLDELIQSRGSRRLDRVDGSDPSALLQATTGMFDLESMVVVHNPHQADLEMLEGFYKDGDNTNVLILYYTGKPRGNTKWGKFTKKHKSIHKSFLGPEKDYERPRIAVEFVQAEAKRHGKVIPLKLATALVVRVGTNLGVLSFEMVKISALANADGVSEIVADHVRGAMAEIAQAAVYPIREALEVRSRRRLIRACDRVKERATSDPTIGVCRLVGASAFKWLSIADLEGVGFDQMAQELGPNPWYLKNKLYPVARRWGKNDLIRLVRAVTEAERAVLQGEVDPWILLCSRLVTVC